MFLNFFTSFKNPFIFLDISFKGLSMSPLRMIESSMLRCTIASSLISLLLNFILNVFSYFSITL